MSLKSGKIFGDAFNGQFDSGSLFQRLSIEKVRQKNHFKMVQQSVPYIIIACAVVVGVVMCIGGCIADKCWYSLFMIIPAACAVFFGYGYYIKSADETEGGWVTASGLLFMVVASMTSLFALPIILWHVGTIRVVSLGLTLGGALVIVIGAGIFLGLVLQDDYGQPLCCHKDY